MYLNKGLGEKPGGRFHMEILELDRSILQCVPKVSVHLMITLQKVTSNI
jgi:hypothetical protein